MVKIRLTRTGKKNYASYRIVVTNLREKRDSRVIEILGHYDPHLKENKYKLDTDRAKYWLSVGAQPSDTVKAFLVKEGIVAKSKFVKKFSAKPGKKATARAEKTAA